MPVPGRRRPRRRRAPAPAPGSRRTVVVALPPAPSGGGQALHLPVPLVLPVRSGGEPWALPQALPQAQARVRELAAFLAVLDVAPPGAVLDVEAGSGEHALLAAAYTDRPVRALEADAVRAHVARQAAASSALAVVVEERRLVPPDGAGAGETIDTYVTRTGLAPAVVRIGDGAGVVPLLAGARGMLARCRPWLVAPGNAIDIPADLIALGYRLITEAHIRALSGLYVLAPEAVGSAYRRRFEAWSAALPAAARAATS